MYVNGEDGKGRLCSRHCRVIVRMQLEVGGDKQSQAEDRADYRNDPGIMKLQSLPAQIWLGL